MDCFNHFNLKLINYYHWMPVKMLREFFNDYFKDVMNLFLGLLWVAWITGILEPTTQVLIMNMNIYEESEV